MGNRRLGTRRLETVMDSMLGHAALNGLNGSPFSIRNPDRVYLEEHFSQLPAVNATLDQVYTVELARQCNKHFELLGANASDADVTFSSGAGAPCGLKLETDGADNDSIIILPHLDSAATAWSSTEWGTENQVEWECAIRTGDAITTQGIWAGLKLTNTDVYATDANQAYFVYGSDDDSGALTTNANLHFVYSIAGTDYISDLDIALAADTNYRLGITIDSDRKVSAWVNGVQYSLTSLTTAGGVTTGAGIVKSTALTDDIDLIPYVGVISRSAAADHMYLFYEKISRIFFE